MRKLRADSREPLVQVHTQAPGRMDASDAFGERRLAGEGDEHRLCAAGLTWLVAGDESLGDQPVHASERAGQRRVTPAAARGAVVQPAGDPLLLRTR
jgi:hypothetical protein